MKKSTLLAVLLLAATLLIGCRNEPYISSESNNQSDNEQTTSNQTESDPEKDESNGTPTEETTEGKIQRFAQFIIDSEYVDAIEYYNDSLLGNFELEVLAQDKIIAICSDINNKVLAGEYSRNEAETKVGAVTLVVNGITTDSEFHSGKIDQIEEEIDSIDNSFESKVAYSVAMELEANKNYTGAIEQYMLVVERDSNFLSAKEGTQRCINLYKQEIITQAQSYADQNDYISAIGIINSAGIYVGQDEELQKQLTLYKYSYEDEVIKQADAYLDKKDYINAGTVVSDALKYIPGSVKLGNKLSEIENAAPTAIENMPIVSYNAAWSDVPGKDRYDNYYEQIFKVDGSCDGYVLFNLDKKYSKFTATLFVAPEASNGKNLSISIYIDEKVVYHKDKITEDSMPEKLEIDTSGGQTMRIVVDNTGSYNTGILELGNGVFEKTK